MALSTFFQGGNINSFAYLDIDNVFMTSANTKRYASLEHLRNSKGQSKYRNTEHFVFIYH